MFLYSPLGALGLEIISSLVFLEISDNFFGGFDGRIYLPLLLSTLRLAFGSFSKPSVVKIGVVYVALSTTLSTN